MAIQNKFSHGSTRMDTDKPLNSSPRKTSGIGVPIRPASAEECHLGFRDSAIETGYLSAYGRFAGPICGQTDSFTRSEVAEQPHADEWGYGSTMRRTWSAFISRNTDLAPPGHIISTDSAMAVPLKPK